MIVRLTQERDVERCSTPTTPEATREMKIPSNCANQLAKKPRTWRGRQACVLCRVSVVCGYVGCFAAVP